MNIAQTYDVIWNDGKDSSEHESQEGARKKAANMSKPARQAFVFAWDGERLSRGWAYEAGRGALIHDSDLNKTYEGLAPQPKENQDMRNDQGTAKTAEAEAGSGESAEATRDTAADPGQGYIQQDSPTSDQESVFQAFKVRAGTVKAQVLASLLAASGPMAENAIAEQAYKDKAKDKGKAPLGMVLRGIQDTIKSKHLPYDLRKTKVGKENHYELSTK